MLILQIPFGTIQTKLNKIDRRVKQLASKVYTLKQDERTSRTRTLIQLGVLVSIKESLKKADTIESNYEQIAKSFLKEQEESNMRQDVDESLLKSET